MVTAVWPGAALPPGPAVSRASAPRDDGADAWQAQQEAMRLGAEARQGRAALEARIGPRGLLLGTLLLPTGRVVPIRAASTDSAKKLWRRMHLGPELEAERANVMSAVRAACERWDAEAERSGLRELERRAAAARDRVRARLNRELSICHQE